MNWSEGGEVWRSGPYVISRTVRGFEAWFYSKPFSGCLGRGIRTLDGAKTDCEKDALERARAKDCKSQTENGNGQ